MTAAGSTTWWAFARAIFDASQLQVSVVAISSTEYSTPALRPHNSVLDNSKLGKYLGITLPRWEVGMEDVLARVSLRGTRQS
jgi:dTDP-4-dehydrorhamnose reductase